MNHINILAWNSRCVSSRTFHSFVRDLVRKYQITIISGDKKNHVIMNLGFNCYFKIYVVGFASGIWFSQDSSYVVISILAIHSQHPNCKVSFKGNDVSFRLTCVYASSWQTFRAIFYNEIIYIANNNSKAQIVSDFNAYLESKKSWVQGQRIIFIWIMLSQKTFMSLSLTMSPNYFE